MGLIARLDFENKIQGGMNKNIVLYLGQAL